MTSSSEQTTALRDSIAKVLDGHQVDWASARDDGVWCECGTSVTPPTWEAVTRHQADFVMVKVAPRVVSTVAELDALPGLSVIRDKDGRVYEKSYPSDGTGWSGTGGDTDYLSAGMLDFIEFPATVLWVGGTE